ncbi:3-carboxy-cis,cis-muconate cycloisomerase [Nonomuraea sp. MCN248]|uniref:3-carboxy-cis,cis-muconate cycloisomerase n=1 Tax=Nonomuraea corallina TaxID=2989783 RepID=A0ABT4SHL4_9ACTN|nr:3-carboxy-cis,cis-muconate cycloisomerase [Nonomuraea corallina]MDA0636711.1 3-carboxy-cis,cis-muconate cycloisomerase [Nonomuraea corallina]
MTSDNPPGDPLDTGPLHTGPLDTGLLAPVRAGVRAERLTSDQAWVRAMLDAESALARAQARAGLVPRRAAEAIARAADDLDVDVAALARRARRSANPVVPLVSDLRAAVGEPAAADVHLGATSQDILDTAAMLVARRATEVILEDLDGVMDSLARLAERHRDTVMAARTLGQHAVPTTFGLKAATWLAGVLRARDRLAAVPLPAQLGGAAGTLSALTEAAATSPGSGEVPREAAGRALAVVELFAEETGLAVPEIPWHAERSVVAELGAALAGVATALGKPAADVILLSQTEVGEVAEAAPGGSSAMPHKRNPALSVLVRAASLQVPGHARALAQVGEHERAAGAWQAEWGPLRECLRLTGGAAETAAELMAGLRVFPDRMSANTGLTGGRLVSERLAAHLGADALTETLRRDGPLEAPAALLDPAAYLGAAPDLVDRVLAAYRDRQGTP